jgi:hypothetical protein
MAADDVIGGILGILIFAVCVLIMGFISWCCYWIIDSVGAPLVEEVVPVVGKNFVPGHFEIQYNVVLKIPTTTWVEDSATICLRTSHGDAWQEVNVGWWRGAKNGDRVKIRYRSGRISGSPRLVKFL